MGGRKGARNDGWKGLKEMKGKGGGWWVILGGKGLQKNPKKEIAPSGRPLDYFRI